MDKRPENSRRSKAKPDFTPPNIIQAREQFERVSSTSTRAVRGDDVSGGHTLHGPNSTRLMAEGFVKPHEQNYAEAKKDFHQANVMQKMLRSIPSDSDGNPRAAGLQQSYDLSVGKEARSNLTEAEQKYNDRKRETESWLRDE